MSKEPSSDVWGARHESVTAALVDLLRHSATAIVALVIVTLLASALAYARREG